MDKLRDYTTGGKVGVIAKIWKSFTSAYGSLWENKYGKVVSKSNRTGEDMLTDVGREWARKLGGFTEKTIDQAVDRCQSVHADRAPNLYQFLKICKQIAPGDQHQHQNSFLCEFVDKRGAQCANKGTLSSGGPWLCGRHFSNDLNYRIRPDDRRKLVEDCHAKFMREHPELLTQPDDKHGDVTKRNIAYMKNILGTTSIGLELPYDKTKSLSGDGSGITREESLRRAERYQRGE